MQNSKLVLLHLLTILWIESMYHDSGVAIAVSSNVLHHIDTNGSMPTTPSSLNSKLEQSLVLSMNTVTQNATEDLTNIESVSTGSDIMPPVFGPLMPLVDVMTQNETEIMPPVFGPLMPPVDVDQVTDFSSDNQDPQSDQVLLSPHICFETSELYDNVPRCDTTQAVDIHEICPSTEWSCRNKCGQVLGNSDVGFRSSCNCDDWCLLYNVCCEDFETQCPDVYQRALHHLEDFGGEQAECSPYARAMLISHCPNAEVDPSQRQRCENPASTVAVDIFPVTDSVTGLHFRNYHCFQCWSTSGQALYWTVDLSFTTITAPSEQYQAIPFIETIVEETNVTKWNPPDDLPAIFCESCAVSQCTGCSDPDLQIRCSSVHSPITIDAITYRNRYCYACSQEYVDKRDSQISTCQVPDIPDYDKFKHPEFLSFYLEIIVTASLVNEVLSLEATHRFDQSFVWTRMECPDSSLACTVTECKKIWALYNGHCINKLEPYTLELQLCLSGDETASPSCIQSDIDEPVMTYPKTEIMSSFQHFVENKLRLDFSPLNLRVINSSFDPNEMILNVNFDGREPSLLEKQKIRNSGIVATMKLLMEFEIMGVSYICSLIYRERDLSPYSLTVPETDCLPCIINAQSSLNDPSFGGEFVESGTSKLGFLSTHSLALVLMLNTVFS